MLKIGILGAGHLGKIHLRIAEASEHYELVGFYDPNPKTVTALTSDYDYHVFDSAEALIQASDVVDIVTPTLSHFEMASLAIHAKKHVFIEKPYLAEGPDRDYLRWLYTAMTRAKKQLFLIGFPDDDFLTIE